MINSPICSLVSQRFKWIDEDTKSDLEMIDKLSKDSLEYSITILPLTFPTSITNFRETRGFR